MEATGTAALRKKNESFPQSFNQSLDILFIIKEIRSHSEPLRFFSYKDLLRGKCRNGLRRVLCRNKRPGRSVRLVTERRKNLPTSLTQSVRQVPIQFQRTLFDRFQSYDLHHLYLRAYGNA